MRILWQDVAVLLFFAFNLGALFLTEFSTTTLASATAYANNLEANPIQRLLLDIPFASFGLRVIIYSLFGTYYLFLRAKRGIGDVAALSFSLFAMLLLFYGLYDFTNDLGVTLGLLYNK